MLNPQAQKITKRLHLPNGKVALLDEDDYERLKNYRWTLQPHGYVAYHKTIYLHKEILKTKKDEIVDHINGDILDNRKNNLRIATRSQNAVNRKKGKRNKYSLLYRGIKFRKGLKKPWIARIGYDHQTKHIGYFATEKEAAMAYNNKAQELYGEFAKLNLITL